MTVTRCDFTGRDAVAWGATFEFEVVIAPAEDLSTAAGRFAIGPNFTDPPTLEVDTAGGEVICGTDSRVTVTVTDEQMEIGDGTAKLNYRYSLKLDRPDGTEDRVLEGRIAITPEVIK